MAGDNLGGTGASPGSSDVDAEPASDEKTWAMLCHLSGFLGYFVVIPFASIIGPLVVWLLKKDSSAFVDAHGKDAINFQITISIIYAFTWFLFFTIVFTLVALLFFPVLGLWMIVLVIVGAIKALNGEYFRYPLTIRFIK
jgi:uncharacterized Tic20 family protein